MSLLGHTGCGLTPVIGQGVGLGAGRWNQEDKHYRAGPAHPTHLIEEGLGGEWF